MKSGTTAFVVIAIVLALVTLITALECGWETETKNKRYSFELASPLRGYAHGIRSEDGFYKVSQPGPTDDFIMQTFLFQFCESMKFNHDPPQCFQCEACGGPEHCGETCSALKVDYFPGFSICTTLGFASNTSFSLMDLKNPEKGIVVNMSAVTSVGQCSISISIACAAKGTEFSTVVNNEALGDCHYQTAVKHPAGCPVVASIKHNRLGWFSILVITLVCVLTVYLVGGIIYRKKVMGVNGLEAIPNLDFWRSILSKIQSGIQLCMRWIMGWYRRLTEPSYVQVS